MARHLIERQTIYDGKKVRLELHTLEDDVKQQRIKAEVIVHPGAVVILPFLDVDTVLLIRNLRISIGQYLLELPAGTLNKGEPPMNAAGRELIEETGYLAKRLLPIGSFFASPGILTERLHAFAAFDLEQRKQALEVDEDIEVRPTAFADAVNMIRDGAIQDAKTIATLLMWQTFHRAGTAVAR
jgi:ADP-ribose pyrophosphatase